MKEPLGGPIIQKMHYNRTVQLARTHQTFVAYTLINQDHSLRSDNEVFDNLVDRVAIECSSRVSSMVEIVRGLWVGNGTWDE